MSATTTAGPRRAALPDATTAPGGASVLADASTRAGERDEMRGRGKTVIADKVFEKIAGQAASEVSTSRGRTGGVLGIGSEANADARPKVDADLRADSVDFDVAVGIAYPGSLRTAAQQVRDRVASRVHELTGVSVQRVDIDITFLTTSTDATSSNSSAPGRGHRKEKLR